MLATRRSQFIKSHVLSGFTLVEMLVAVALVLLMMTMFAEIFSIATGTMSKQKALAELDQRQRLTSTLIRADLQGRTFRKVIAIHPAESIGTQNSANRTPSNEGYIYISENDADNDNDDVLQLTVKHDPTGGGLFFGKAAELVDKNGIGISRNPNQPENDDAPGNSVGSSTTAEVAYFLRSGTLYRRILLVRDTPYLATIDSPMTLDDPPSSPTESLIQTGIYPQSSGSTPTCLAVGTLSNRFPVDFDYSACYDLGAGRLEFLGGTSLKNSQGSAASLVLALPNRRFGFKPTPDPRDSRPLEFLNYASNGTFIGRFTHEETSHSDFAYPGNPGLGVDDTFGTADDTNPYTRSGLTMGASRAVSTYAGGTRQGEDILMTNVLGFDIKVWDNVLARFVDIGHSGRVGEYAQNPTSATNGSHGNKNRNYGPVSYVPVTSADNRCFDTWHTNLNPIDPLSPPYSISNRAPFRPVLNYGADGVPGTPLDDDKDGNLNNDEEIGWPGSDDPISPMKAIQIRIRYRDVSSGAARDFTLIESLVDWAICHWQSSDNKKQFRTEFRSDKTGVTTTQFQ